MGGNGDYSQAEAIKARSISLLATLKTLDRWMDDPAVNEIMVTKPGFVTAWVQGQWRDDPCPAITIEWLDKLGTQVSSFTATPFNTEMPELSGYLPGGQRLEMTMAPACPLGRIYLNLRKPNGAGFPVKHFVDSGYFTKTRHVKSAQLTDPARAQFAAHLPPEAIKMWELAIAGQWEEFLRLAVASKQNIVVAGATGSGKTSFIRSLVDLVSPKEHLITVEDTHEMPLPNHPFSQHLFYKKAGAKTGLTAKEALQACMRKTPSRVLLAELRSDETFYYIQNVLNSGHPGGMTTVHANSAKDTFLRLALLVKASPEGMSLSFDEVTRMLYSLVHVVVQLIYDHEQGRYCPEIYFDPMYSLSLMS